MADEYDGRFLAASIDVDAVPQIAQAMQIPQVPLMLVILDGRPATQPIPGAAPIDDIRALFNQARPAGSPPRASPGGTSPTRSEPRRHRARRARRPRSTRATRRPRTRSRRGTSTAR
ncbi:hypothetical protein [Nocardioides convexus]|uniref:thioredoxin family protein n=1 Tax=Nocardioides convexus TaxID=2712224 RepID=UPI002418B1F8|nr:hypothetical protein [Nocardioides convexus]